MKLMHIALIGLLVSMVAGCASAITYDAVEISDGQWYGHFDYNSWAGYSETLGTAGSALGCVEIIPHLLYTADINSLLTLDNIVYAHKTDGKLQMPVATVWDNSDPPTNIWADVTYTCGGSTIGTGYYQATIIYSSIYPYSATNAIILFTFEDINIGALTGAQTISITYNTVDLDNVIDSASISTLTSGGCEKPYFEYTGYDSLSAARVQSYYGTNYDLFVIPGGYYSGNRLPIYGLEITAYHSVDFEQEFYFSESGSGYAIDYSKNGVSNLIKIVDDDGNVLLQSNDERDIYNLFASQNTPYVINVTNPYVSSGTYAFYDWQLPPEDEEEPATDAITGTYYVYDTATGSLISNVHCVENTTLDGGGLDDSSGSVPYQHTFDTDAYNRWQIYFYADGYENSTTSSYYQAPYAAQTGWSYLSGSFQQNVYLTPTGTPSNTTSTVSFKVNKEMGFAGSGVSWYAGGASVTLDGATKLTSSQGLTSFTVDNNDTYAYTVTLADRVPVQGSVTVGTTNEHVEVTLYFPAKEDPVPTETQPSGVYDNRPFNEKADDALAIVFDNIMAITYLAVLVLIVSMLKWLKI